MKHFFPVWLVLAFLGLSAIGFAAEGDRLEVTEVRLDGNELVLRVADEKPVMNVCHFYLARLDYLKSIQVLNLEFDSLKPCPFDQYGKREGVLKWKVPSTLSAQEPLKLILNGQNAGELKVGGGKVTYQRN